MACVLTSINKHQVKKKPAGVTKKPVVNDENVVESVAADVESVDLAAAVSVVSETESVDASTNGKRFTNVVLSSGETVPITQHDRRVCQRCPMEISDLHRSEILVCPYCICWKTCPNAFYGS